MKNELQSICSLLNGYGEDSFEVLEAHKSDSNGTWELIIKRVEEKEAADESNK